MKTIEFQPSTKNKSYSTPSRLRYRLERIWLRNWLRKLILRTFLVIFILASLLACLILFKDDIEFKDFNHTLDGLVFGRPELSIHSLDINNANPDLSNQIRAILQLSFPINPLKININYLQELINGMESVDFSKIRITENGVLEVFIKERIPVLVHRNDKQLMLLDITGRRIGVVYSRLDRQDLPLVVGLGANLRVQEALEIYKLSNLILDRIRGLMLVGERRWDIVLNLNQRIKLPEKDPKKTLLRFFGSDKFMKILSHDFSVIDLRNHGRVVVRKKTLVQLEKRS